MPLADKMIGAKSEWWRPRLYPLASFYIVCENRRSPLCSSEPWSGGTRDQKIQGLHMKLLGVKVFAITHFTFPFNSLPILQHLGHSSVAHHLHSYCHVLMQYRQWHHAHGFDTRS